MGHANIETTMDIYAEVTDAKKKEAIENLSHNLDIFQGRVLKIECVNYNYKIIDLLLSYYEFCLHGNE